MENFVLRERLVEKNSWQYYAYQAHECGLHICIYHLCSGNWDRGINDFATTTEHDQHNTSISVYYIATQKQL